MANLDSRDLKKLQGVLLEILKTIDTFCKQNNITYFIDSGTVLGAMRHGGFIPWDDDIDLGMLREDYDRFLALAETGLPEGYSLHTYENTPGFSGMFAKVYKDGTVFATEETIESGCEQGIFVDIFPYDQLALDEQERARQLKQCDLWQKISYLYHAKRVVVPLKGVLGMAAKAACWCAHYVVRALFSREQIALRFAESCKFKGSSSDDWADLPYAYYPSHRYDVLFPTVLLKFEDAEFPAPGKTDEYLTRMYGENWRELPPVENRRTHKPVKLDFGEGEGVV